jgi:hypothetical protein
MKRSLCLSLLCLCLTGITVFAQASPVNDSRVSELITKVKSVPASDLDKKLPAVRLEDWFQAQAGKGGSLGWVFRHDPAAGTVHKSGFPDCVEVDGKLKSGRGFVVLIDVGTDAEHPRVYDILVVVPNRRYGAGVSKLSGLPDALRRMYPETSGFEAQR